MRSTIVFALVALAAAGCASGPKGMRTAESLPQRAQPQAAPAKPAQICEGPILATDSDAEMGKKFDCFMEKGEDRASPEEIMMQLLEDQLKFNTNMYEIPEQAKELIARVSNVLNQPGRRKVCMTAIGNTDPTGDASYNKWLSEKRAQSFANALGIKNGKISTRGVGSSALLNKQNPTAPENRRVDIVNKCD